MNRRKRLGPPFVMMHKQVLKSPEWKRLSHVEKLLYLYVKAGYNGSNNGDIPFDYSKYTNEFSSRTIAKVLGDPNKRNVKEEKGSLIRKGWLERKMVGGRYRYKVFFRLTARYDIIK